MKKDELAYSANHVYREGYLDGFQDGKNGWIACSDRLPDENGDYLVCYWNNMISVISYEGGWNCFIGVNGRIHNENEITGVVAWMPLPEPFREDGAE